MITLAVREPICEGKVALITPARVWDMRTTFRLDDGHESDQLDTERGVGLILARRIL